MVAAVPTLDQVIDAIHGVMAGIGALSGNTILKGEHQFEDDVEFIEVNNLISGGALDVWFIDLESTSPFPGEGVGESYDRYNIRIRYWSMRTNDVDWSDKARDKATAVADALTDHASVFKIGGQVQLFTGTEVAVSSHGPAQIRDVARSAGQMIFETILSLSIEARRWS